MGLFSVEDTKDLFLFNLLPPKSKSELESQAKKVLRNTYTAMMPLVLLVIGLFLFILNNVILKSNLKNWKASVSTITAELANPDNYLGSLKVRNGELKTKTDYIAEPVSRNVDFAQIFVITGKAFQNNKSGSVATSYGRESDGRFIVNAVATKIDGPAEILGKYKKDENVKDAWIEIVQKDTTNNLYRYTIAFEITAINTNSEETADAGN